MDNILVGADIVIEFDRTTLLNFLRANPMAARFRTPFEEVIRLSDAQGGGEAHFIFDDSDIFLGVNSEIELKLDFSRSSVVGNNLVRRALNGADLIRLSGKVRIFIPISIEPGSLQTDRDLVLNLLGVRATTQFNPPTNTNINPPSNTNILDHIRQVQTLLQALLRNEIEQRIRLLAGNTRQPTNPRIPLPIQINRTVPPSLSPLIANDVRLRVLTHENPSQQALAIFISLSADGLGRPEERIKSELPPGQNFAVAMAPWVFRRFVFTPAMQNALLVARSDLLPAVLGRAESVPYPNLPEASITLVEDTLRDNAIGITLKSHLRGGSGDPEDPFGNTIHVDIRATLTFTVDATQRIVPRLHIDETSARQSFGWGWWLIGIFGPYLTMALAAGVTAALGGSIGRNVTPTIDAVNAPLNIPGGTIRTVNITASHFALAGTVPRPAPGSAFRISLEASSSMEKGWHQVAEGMYRAEGCPNGEYPFTVRHRTQQIRFTCSPSFASYPVTFVWFVHGVSRREQVTGNGTVRIDKMQTFPDPLPGTTNMAEVELQYTVSEDGKQLSITIPPEDGNFLLMIECIATDIEGRTSTQHGNVVVTTREVTLGGTWNHDLEVCIREASERLRGRVGIEGLAVGNIRVPDPGTSIKFGRLTPEIMGAFLMQSSLTGKQGIQQINHALMTYGVEFHLLANVPNDLSPEILIRLLQEDPIVDEPPPMF